jgi:hypothetical protein
MLDPALSRQRGAMMAAVCSQSRSSDLTRTTVVWLTNRSMPHLYWEKQQVIPTAPKEMSGKEILG